MAAAIPATTRGCWAMILARAGVGSEKSAVVVISPWARSSSSPIRTARRMSTAGSATMLGSQHRAQLLFAAGQHGAVTRECAEAVLMVGDHFWRSFCDKEACLFSRRIVQQDAGCAHEADALLKKMKSFFCRRVMPVCLSDWIWLSHNGLTSVRQGLPYFFGNKGHERMNKSQKHLERLLEHSSSCRTLRMHCVLENRFDQFKVPIAVLMPEKVVESISRSVKPVGF